ncbi:CHAT domain-containing protein [Amylostereum chailletii]|nr:CHAT domain-containing protein [Amylostereum chailletii]
MPVERDSNFHSSLWFYLVVWHLNPHPLLPIKLPFNHFKYNYSRSGSQRSRDLSYVLSLIKRPSSLGSTLPNPSACLIKQMAEDDVLSDPVSHDDGPQQSSSASSSYEHAEQLTAAGPVKSSISRTLISHVEANDLRSLLESSTNIDLHDTVESRLACIATLTSDDCNLETLNVIGAFLSKRFQERGELVDIQAAINTYQHAATLTPDDHSYQAACHNGLGNALLAHFQRSGDLVDVEGSVNAHRRAIQLTPEGDADKATFDSAISAQQQAVNLTRDDHPDKTAFLNNLGNSYQTRFLCLHDLIDLHNAITAQQQAVEYTPEDHPNKSAFLNIFGNTLVHRFELLGEVVDLDNAIIAHQRALEFIPEGHADKAGRLNNLANSFQTRFRRLGEVDDLDNAIRTQQRAIDLTPKDDINKAMFLANLANAFRARFERLGNLVDLETSIDNQQQAVELTPLGHANKATFVNKLAIFFKARFEPLGEIVDLDRAISAQQKTVELTPEGHPRGLDTSVPLDSPRHLSGPPFVRFVAAKQWARLASEHPALSPLDAYKLIMELVPRLVWPHFKLHRDHEHFTSITVAVSEATAAAIIYGDLASALEWVEQGQCMVWGQTLQHRASLEALRAVDAKLADDLEGVLQELEKAGVQGGDSSNVSPEIEAQRHRRFAEEYDRVVAKARKLPGCEGFLRPKTLAELRGAADSGPVVVVNVGQQRSDALVLRRSSDEVIHVPLPALNHETADRWRDVLGRSLKSSTSGVGAGDTMTLAVANGEIPRVLAQLWSSVVQPVLRELKCQERRVISPHVTWCATGPLAFLPLHAAGLYDQQGGPKIYDYIVPSYTYTLTALLKGGRKHPQTSIPSILVVSQPGMSGQHLSPGTMDEIAAIEECVGKPAFCWMDGEQATKDAVLKAMTEHDWIHLACRIAYHPMKSAFILHDGRMELVDIMKGSPNHTDLAVLSSCQATAGAEELPEETIPLLSAEMFMAGYRSVIATLWPIPDGDALVFARELYSRLVDDAHSGDEWRTAYALHDTVKHLRDEVGEGEFMRWVPFIHIGHASLCRSVDDPETSTSRKTIAPINASSEFKKIRQSLALLESRLEQELSSPDPQPMAPALQPGVSSDSKHSTYPRPGWPSRPTLRRGSTHWMSYFDMIESSQKGDGSDYWDAPDKDIPPDVMGARYATDSDLVNQLPSMKVIDSLVDYYFEHSNWIYRYVHEAAFTAQWARYKTGDYPSRLILAMVWVLMAIALCHLPDGHEILDELSDPRSELRSRYYRSMLDFLAREPMDSTQYGLDMVELLLAQCHYLTLTQVESEELWYLKGKLVTIALALGLHHEPEDDSIPELNERRRWAWWNVLCVDRCQAFIMGRPLSIASHHFNTRLPYSTGHSNDKGRMYVGPIALLRLYHLVGEFMFDVTSFQSVPYGTILDKDNLLQEWFDTLSSELSLDDQSLARSLSSSILSIRRFAIQGLVLRTHFFHTRFTLHHAASVPLQQDSPEKTTSMNMAVEAAGKLIALVLHIQPQDLGESSASVMTYLSMIPYHVLSSALFLALLILDDPFKPSHQTFRHNIGDAVTVLERFAGKPYADKALSIMRVMAPLCSELAVLEGREEFQKKKADALAQVNAFAFPDNLAAATRSMSFTATPMSMTSHASSPLTSVVTSSHTTPSTSWTAFRMAGSGSTTANDTGGAGFAGATQRRIRSGSDPLSLSSFTGLGYSMSGGSTLDPSSGFTFEQEEAQVHVAGAVDLGDDFVWPGDLMGDFGEF